MKIICVIFMISTLFLHSNSTDVSCVYDTFSFGKTGHQYGCFVSNKLNIVHKQLTSVKVTSGSHKADRSNDDVFGFYAGNRNTQYFPKGLDKFFKNLNTISIYNGPLSELTQDDLRPYSKLENLYLYSNIIEVLEAGVFDNNKLLVTISLKNNRLVHVDENVFNNLNNLQFLFFELNPCLDKNIENNPFLIKAFIKLIYKNCTNSEFLDLTKSLKELEVVHKNIKLENLSTLKLKVEKFEDSFGNSTFVSLTKIEEKLQNLQKSRDQVLWGITDKKNVDQKLKLIITAVAVFVQIIIFIVSLIYVFA
ncbi:hypothetical protein ACKWTF_015359 [Chironomus riparius]